MNFLSKKVDWCDYVISWFPFTIATNNQLHSVSSARPCDEAFNRGPVEKDPETLLDRRKWSAFQTSRLFVTCCTFCSECHVVKLLALPILVYSCTVETW